MNIQKPTYLAYYIPYMECEISGKLKPILCLAVIAALLPLMSCDNSHPPELAGHWLHESGSTDKKPEDMELFKDGIGMCDGGSISWKVEDKRLIVLSPTLGFASDYEVAGYRLALTDKAGKSTYVNINEDYQQKGIFADSRDGKKYGTIKIGEQTWMSENLNYEAEGSRCYGEYGEKIVGWDDYNPIYKTLSGTEIQANCEKYGRLYDWKTAMALPDSCNERSCSSQISAKHGGICPSGWYLPSNDEWETLVDFAVDEFAGENLKARSGWDDNGNGTDIYGFSALPGGIGSSDGDFYHVGRYGYW